MVSHLLKQLSKAQHKHDFSYEGKDAPKLCLAELFEQVIDHLSDS